MPSARRRRKRLRILLRKFRPGDRPGTTDNDDHNMTGYLVVQWPEGRELVFGSDVSGSTHDDVRQRRADQPNRAVTAVNATYCHVRT